MLIPGMNETMAQNILQSGFGSFQSLSTTTPEEVMTIPGYDDADKAKKLITEAADLVKSYKDKGTPVPVSPQTLALKENAGSMKQKAEQQLKAELSKLSSQEEK